jgi:hypothetical protein
MKRLPPEKWSTFLAGQPETGIGYWTGNVEIADGRTFTDVIINSGYITKIRGRTDIPFEGADVVKIEITGRRWNWEE